MTNRFLSELNDLKTTANYRVLPPDTTRQYIDLSSNDYLGIASRDDLRHQFFDNVTPEALSMSSSASRLLLASQRVYKSFESTLESLYDRPALMFNSGYHANTGIVSAIADKNTLIIADRLVHASIIDGIVLSKADFTRFRHNDFNHLVATVEKNKGKYETMLVIVESVYSMDGDKADIDALIDIKRSCPEIMLYVDEAHGFGVEGPSGLGLVAASKAPGEVDIVIGTLGKAAASEGAFCIVDDIVKEYLVNRSRSLIFSTAIAPINVAWSDFIVKKMVEMDSERANLRHLAERLARLIPAGRPEPSHIRPLVVGDSAKTILLSDKLKQLGVKALPIRTPTVPPGTERLRFSLSAALSDADIDVLETALGQLSPYLTNRIDRP